MQVPLSKIGLSSVSVPLMSSLLERLKLAAASKTPEVKQAAMARACGVSRAAVAGWFAKENFALQATHAFALAKLLGVDPEWLATGRGQMIPKPFSASPADTELIEASRQNDPTFASFVQDYRRLSSVEKTMVRTVVVALARSHDPVYQAYEKNQQSVVRTRPTKPAKTKV